jgi:SpoVK/Ycf46/Vps4 family AAA+-type ATPase
MYLRDVDDRMLKRGIKIRCNGNGADVINWYEGEILSFDGDLMYIARYDRNGGRWGVFKRHHLDIEIEFIGQEEAPKNFKVDLKKLAPLVLKDSVKEEITAVLKQHENVKKLFEDWGLGEVIEYGKGMTFLFYGPPGTGKTWAANCIAKALGKELLVVGSAEIQTSEPGGANRAIQAAFKSGKDKVLLLDECDSLITSRNDVGMIIGSEINTLLTEIEKSTGVTILTTNRIETLDEALERRIALIVEFPEPNQEERLQIWNKLIPQKLPLEKDVDLEKLSGYKLTGGQIKNVILQAARLAISDELNKVPHDYFVAAIVRTQASRDLMGKRHPGHRANTDKVRG